MTDVLGRAVIEVGVDEMRLQDELGQSQRTMSNSFAASLNRTKMTAGEMQKLSVLNRDLRSQDMSRVKLGEAQVRTTMKLASATKWHAEMVRKLTGEGGKRETVKGGVDDMRARLKSFWENRNEIARDGLSKVGQVAGVGGGMAFAAAMAAGSTTLDTLTGSLKMLSMAAGGKTQAGVLKISEYIQRLAKVVENAPSGTIGGVGGALAGFKLGGVPGAIAGAAGGALFEANAAASLDARRMAIQSKNKPDEVSKLWNEKTRLEANKWRGFEDQQRLITINRSLKMLEGKQSLPEMKTAGLNLPASYIGLADVRQQAQMAAVSKGPLEMENFKKELELNRKALEMNTQEIKKGNGGPGNVQPPGQ